jgi:nucleoside-diphosphate-sugar epimerase
MTTLMITGASGFVGSSLIKWIITQNKILDFNKIYLVSRNVIQFKNNFHTGNIEVIEKDLLTEWNFNFQVNTLINLAADGSVDPYSKDSNKKYKSINENLIKWGKNHCERIIHASSGAAKWYQSSLKVSQLDNTKEFFIKTRGEVEQELEDAFQDRVIICRLFSFIGEFLVNKEQYAINSFIKQGIENKVINISGNPNSTRSYLGADDMCNWIYRTLNLKGPQVKFEIGSEFGYSISRIASIVAETLRVDVKLTSEGNSKISENYVADSRNTKSILGVSETIKTPELINEYINIYKHKFNYE